MKLFTTLLTGLTLLLTACAPTPTPGGSAGSSGQPEPVITKGEPLTITAFEFTHSGSIANDCYWYSIEETKEGVRFQSEGLYSGGEIVDLVVDDDQILTQLGELAGTYQADRWNGFDQTNSMVLDGSGFSVRITLADGGTISARGSNSFPKGFGEFHSELNDLVVQAFARHGAKAPMDW